MQSVAPNAFAGCVGLVEVRLPSSVTSVGVGAFQGCSGLSSVSLSTSLASLGAAVFEGCDVLMMLVLPTSLTAGGAGAFGSASVAPCNSAASILFVPVDMAASVYSSAQASCTVSSYFVGAGSTTGCVDKYTPVSACGSGAIVVSTAISSLANGAFAFTSVTSVAIPTNVLRIGDNDASNYGGVFAYSSSLTGVSLPTSLTAMGAFAFIDCYSLPSIIIPEGVTSIGEYAFFDCTSLSSITIPISVSTIGDLAFGYTDTPPCGITGTNATLYVPASMAVSVYSGVQYSCGMVTYTPGWPTYDFQ